MVREYKDVDFKQVNNLLSFFNKNINLENNPFYKCLVYEEDNILGVIVFEEIYERVELDYIIVDKNYRKCGIAGKLICLICSQRELLKSTENIQGEAAWQHS